MVAPSRGAVMFAGRPVSLGVALTTLCKALTILALIVMLIAFVVLPAIWPSKADERAFIKWAGTGLRHTFSLGEFAPAPTPGSNAGGAAIAGGQAYSLGSLAPLVMLTAVLLSILLNHWMSQREFARGAPAPGRGHVA